MEYRDRSAAFMQALDSAMGDGARAAGEVVLARWVALMREPKTGRLYKRTEAERFRGVGVQRGRGRRGFRVHRASAPGEAPAIDFGRLVQSLGVEVTREARGWAARIGPRGEGQQVKLMTLEFGTNNLFGRGIRLLPRPSARPALELAAQPAREKALAVVRRRMGGGRWRK